MASPPRRTLMGAHCVAMAGRALVCARATAAWVAVAFCRLALEAVDPPPNMLPIEPPASRATRPGEATTRIKVFLVMSVLPARLCIGGFKRHEDRRGAAGVHPRSILDENIGHHTVAHDHCGAGIARAHSEG